MRTARMQLTPLCVILLFVTSVCSGEQPMVEEKAQEIRNAVTVGMTRVAAESALHRLNIEPQYVSRDALARLYGTEWMRHQIDLQGRLCGRMIRVATHMIGETDLYIEVDINNEDKVSALRVKPVQMAP